MSFFSHSFVPANPIDQPLVVILLGPPGSGKGTHAKPLSEHFSIPHISTGDLFRAHLEKKTPLGDQVQRYLDQGALVPDDLVIDMLFSRIAEKDCKKGYILDGFPRSLYQAERLLSKMHDTKLAVIHLSVEDAVITERILGRLLCKGCQTSFHEIFCPPKICGVCDHCSTPFVKRSDDTKTIINKRLQAYHQEIAPIVSFYTKKGCLFTIDASGKKEEIFHDTIQEINQHLAKERSFSEAY